MLTWGDDVEAHALHARGLVDLGHRPPCIGRHSGKERTVPVFHLRDGERLVICNVNPGFERPNPWTLNLRANPVARVRAGRDVASYRAREADLAEIERYWPQLVTIWPAYESFYRRSHERSIFVLERDPAPGTAA